jgi:DNA-directed RNA polymerase specialized sigma24 family protein
MAINDLLSPPAYHSDSDADEILLQYDAYIVDLAQNNVPRNVVHPEVLYDEISEIAQKVRIKLWLNLRKKYIKNIKAYIRCIVCTEVVDMVRQYRSTSSLLLNEDGELYQGNMIAVQGEGMQDPAYEVEQEEALNDSVQAVSEVIMKFPPRQQYATICSLKAQLDDVFPVMDVLRSQVIDIEAIRWPEKRDELQNLRVSLSVARKKLRSLKRR